jgi:branched-chain amino acid transport system permease protein
MNGSGPRGAALAGIAVVLALACALPFLLSNYRVFQMTLVLAYAVALLGLNMLTGYNGQISLGHGAFYAIGAYTAAYFASGFWDNAGPDGQGVAILVSGPASELPGIHVNFLLVFVLAVAATTVAGALIGVPTLRLRGDYVAIVTLAFGEIIGQVAANGGDIALFGGTLTAGPNNIGPIDKIDLPFLEPFDALDPRPWYWFALGLVVLALVVAVRLRDSRIGRAWTALRDDEGAAAATGIPIARTKLTAYATGAAFGGVSGAFLASYFSAVNAGQFEFSFSLFIFSMVVLGGVGSIRGVVVGAIVLSEINSYLLPDVLYSLPRRVGLEFDFSAIASGVYGAIIVLVMLLRPAGLVPAASSVMTRTNAAVARERELRGHATARVAGRASGTGR